MLTSGPRGQLDYSIPVSLPSQSQLAHLSRDRLAQTDDIPVSMLEVICER